MVVSVGPQQFQYVACVAQRSARSCEVGSPAVATTWIRGYVDGWYLDSMDGVQMSTSSCGGCDHGQLVAPAMYGVVYGRVDSEAWIGLDSAMVKDDHVWGKLTE